MKNRFYFYSLLLGIAVHCTAMEQQPNELNNGCDSPQSVLNSPELLEQATTFLSGFTKTTQQQEALLVAQLERACSNGDKEKARQIYLELEEAHAWNKQEWEQWKNDYRTVLEQYEALHEPKQRSLSTSNIVASSTEATSDSSNQPPNGRRRAFSLKDFKAGSLLRHSGQ